MYKELFIYSELQHLFSFQFFKMCSGSPKYKRTKLFLQIFNLVIIFAIFTTGLKNVAKFSPSDWTLENVNEGPCIIPAPTPAEFDTTWLLRALKSDWYVLLASRMYIYSRAKLRNETITGKYLKTFCLRFKPSTNVAVIVGVKTSQTEPVVESNVTNQYDDVNSTTKLVGCKTKEIGKQDCVVKLDNPDDDDDIIEYKVIEGIAAWTDNKQFIIYTFCSSNSTDAPHKKWILMANQREISEKDKNMILDKIEDIGFNRTYAYSLSYDLCTKLHNKAAETEI